MTTVLIALALVAGASASEPSIRQGIRQVDEGDLSTAVVTLTNALERHDAQAPDRERALGYVYLGMAQLGLGQADPARASLRYAWSLNQGTRLDAKRFPPRVVRLYDEVGAEVRARAKPTKSTRSLAIVGTTAGVGLGAVAAVVAGGSASAAPPSSPPPAALPVSVRLFNNDDAGRVFLGGTLFRQVGLGEDTGLVDVTSRLAPGGNEIAFELENAHGAISYGFEVYVGDAVVFRETCGVVFRGGCESDQRFPAGVVRRFTFSVQR